MNKSTISYAGHSGPVCCAIS